MEDVKTAEFGHFFFSRPWDDGSIYAVTNDGSLHCSKLPAIITGDGLSAMRTIQAGQNLYLFCPAEKGDVEGVEVRCLSKIMGRASIVQ